VARWNGRRWRLQERPPPGGGFFLVSAVSGRAADDVWLVGNRVGNALTLTMHWDGRRWRVVPSPTSRGGTWLRDVVAIDERNVWAVGATTGDHGKPVALHWNGQRWRLVQLPGEGEIESVAAVSARDVWAVGWQRTRHRAKAAVWHSNGSRWARLPVPATPLVASSLSGVSTAGARTVWAVGETDTNPDRGQSGRGWAIALRWDGRRLLLDSATFMRKISSLDRVVAVKPNSIWAAQAHHSVFVHRDAHTWTRTAQPPFTRFKDETIAALAASPGGLIWGVGSYWDTREHHSVPLITRNDCRG
jgi:hypothetical protein